jgi:uncharacterized SAM-binding protein YcdF (DUF218 family)
VRYAYLFNLAFSVSGLLTLLAAICAWLLIRPRSRPPRMILLVVVIWYCTVGIYPIPHALGHLWSREFAPLTRSDVPPGRVAIVLLGSGSFTAVDWAGNRAVIPDPIGLERALEAARLWALLDPAWVISSGGPASRGSSDFTSGEAMRDALVRLGVPASRVILKDDAADTHDEAQNVAGLLPGLHVDHVVLVTSAVHMRRARATFRAAGVSVIPAPAREDEAGILGWRMKYLPSERGLYEASLTAHEVLGAAYYRLRGWL